MKVLLCLGSCLLLLGSGCTSGPEPAAADPDDGLQAMQELRTRNQALIEANEELQVEKEVLEGRIEELQQRERRLAQTLRKREFELRQQEIQIRDLADLRDQRNAARSQVRALQEKIAELRLRLEGSSASDSEP